MNVPRYVLAWVTVTLLVTMTAWGVVSAASNQVNDSPLAPIIDAGSGATLATTIATSTLVTSTVVGIDSSTSPTTTPGGTSTSTNSGTVPSTTIPGSSTTTSSSSSTTVAGTSGTKTISTVGGTVTVSWSNGNVYYESASPAIGYSAEIEDTGPEQVRVDFEGDGHEVSVRVEWVNGMLDIEIED